MQSPPNAATRRFAVVWSASLAVKILAIAVLLFVVIKVFGGNL
jgi:hypothetical protein